MKCAFKDYPPICPPVMAPRKWQAGSVHVADAHPEIIPLNAQHIPITAAVALPLYFYRFEC